MIANELRAHLGIIERTATIHCIDPKLLMALVWQETRGDTWACRYEKNIFDRHLFYMTQVNSKALNITLQTEMTFQATSWGLMQILGVVAREEGFDGHLNKLSLPEYGLPMAAKHFGRLLDRYKNTDDAIAAYNAGNAKDRDPHAPGTQYSNADYVRQVNEHFEMIKGGIDAPKP